LIMFGAILSALDNRNEKKTWNSWLEYILKKQKKLNLNFKRVALHHTHGRCLAATANAMLEEADVLWAQKIMASKPLARPETISVEGVTYVIKSVTSSQIIAFNGSKYLIFSRSKSIVIYTVVKSKACAADAEKYLQKIIEHLVKKNH